MSTLSGPEREVLELVAAVQTKPQIAAGAVHQAKSAEHHVSNVLTEFGGTVPGRGFESHRRGRHRRRVPSARVPSQAAFGETTAYFDPDTSLSSQRAIDVRDELSISFEVAGDGTTTQLSLDLRPPLPSD